MSFTSEFETLLNEKKKNAQSQIGLFNAYSQELAAKQQASGIEILQAGALDDGYQIGDITKIILGTAGEAATDVGQGFMGFSEGIADWLGHNVVYPIARATGQTENDLKWYRKALNESTTQKVLGGVDAALDKHSVLGHTTDAVLQGVGQFIPMVAGGKVLQAAGAGATAANLGVKGMMGVSAMGSAQSEAYAGGATDGEALAYGAASAGSELLFESLFGGMGKALNMVGFSKGLSSLDDIAAKGIAKFISSPAGKNVAQMLVKGGFEGLEEVGTGVAQAFAKKLTYMSEEEFGKILKDENLFEQFLVGALVSDISQAGDVRIANKTGTDLVTGFTRNEQAVIDKEVENRIAQEEKGGRKLSGKEKSKIYDQVVHDMERGYISTETIESVLGKDALTQYDALSKEAEEFKTLYETEGGKLSEKQKDRLAELKAKNKTTPYEQQLKSQREKISKDVSAMARNDRLGESYAEQTRKGEKFQADVSKYSEAQRKTVQNAIDCGILNNTNRSHEFVDLIAKISADKGISFDFADNAKLKESGFALDGVLVNGFVNENGVTINVQSAKALNRVVGHEITHVLEGTELYDALQSAVTEYAKTKKDYNRRLKELTQLYKGKNANVEQELVADLVGDYLFTDADFIKHLSTEHRNLFQKIYDEIKYLCKIVTAGTKEARQLEKVKKAFADAYRAETKNPTADGGVKYSINSKFYEQLDSWDGKTIGFSFVVGETSQALQEAGIPQKQIRWDASKISTLLAKHRGMTIETVREIPELLEKPVIVVDSKKGSNAKIVMGDLRDSNGKVVTAVLLLTPTSKKGNVLDLVKISSAEGRSHIKSLFTNEDGTAVPVRYVDKKRIQSWLNVNGLQLPLHNLDSDSVNIISEPTEKSNTKFSLTTDERKVQQLAIIMESNPMWDDYHVGIRSVEDIHTWEEVLDLDDEREGQFAWGDFSREDAENALKNNSVTVYSSHPISNGTFVSTSYTQAWEYAGGNKNSKVYSKEVPLDDVAWINGDEGEYAKLEDSQGVTYSLSKKDFSIAPPVGADVHGKDIGYDIAPPVPESVKRANKKRPAVGDPAYAPIAEKYPPKVNPEDSTGAAPSGFDPVSHLQYEYGSLPEGEKPVREDSLPKSTNGKDKVSLTGRTVKGAEATPDALVDLLDKTVVEGGLSYIPLSNDATVQKAYDRIRDLGWEEALADWKADVRAGKVSAELSATGALLLNNAANAGDRTRFSAEK